MISKDAENLLKRLIDTYHKTGQKDFDYFECLPTPNLDKALIELNNDLLVNYDNSHIVSHVELLEDGINYKF